jgi:hypothetical protein
VVGVDKVVGVMVGSSTVGMVVCPTVGEGSWATLVPSPVSAVVVRGTPVVVGVPSATC